MHPSHQKNIGSLNRVSGQVEAIKRMINDKKYCVDIMIQLKAARSALKAIELSVLEIHMHSCLEQACNKHPENKSEKIKEIITLLKKYE